LTQRAALLFTCTPFKDAWVPENALTADQLTQKQRFLTEDLQVDCDSPEHLREMLGMGIPYVVMYVIGIPVLLMFLLWRAKRSAAKRKATDERDSGRCRSLTFLTMGYRDSCSMWEVREKRRERLL
jgi:hypothetical protein